MRARRTSATARAGRHHQPNRFHIIQDILEETRRRAAPIQWEEQSAVYQSNQFEWIARNLARHHAYLHIPYHPSLLSLLEAYQLGLPCFHPSVSAMLRWEAEALLRLRVWKDGEPMYPPPPDLPSHPYRLDANLSARHFWLSTWRGHDEFFEHMQYFDSAQDLHDKLETLDLVAISMRMQTSLRRQFKQATPTTPVNNRFNI